MKKFKKNNFQIENFSSNTNNDFNSNDDKTST